MMLHEPRRRRSWLIFDVRCFRSCPAVHMVRSFTRRRSVSVAREALVVKGLPCRRSPWVFGGAERSAQFECWGLGLHPAHHVQVVVLSLADPWLLLSPSGLYHH